MSGWLIAVMVWVAGLPLVTAFFAALMRGGRIADEGRLVALARSEQPSAEADADEPPAAVSSTAAA